VADSLPPSDGVDAEQIPLAVAAPARPWRLSLVWLIPVVAAVIGAWLGIGALLERGPSISISFRTAEGIEPEKTRIKYRNVDVGVVKRVELSADRRQVLVIAQLSRQVDDLLVEDTKFWVVRPRVSGGNVSGLGTVLSGSHIAMEAGRSKRSSRDFVGQEQPSIDVSDVVGRELVLRAKDIGSLYVGSLVYFRRLVAGQVLGFELDKDGNAVNIRVFINAPFDRHVNANSRFWHAQGVDISLDANGLKVNTGSLFSVLLGGLAFETLENAPPSSPAPAGTVFNVYADRVEAMRVPDAAFAMFRLIFKESVRGLSPGAPVDFRGVVVGEVVTINLEVDPQRFRVDVPVDVKLYPNRLGYRPALGPPGDPKDLMGRLVDGGFRAQLRPGNLITSQLYVALDYFPNAPKAGFDRNRIPPELPTMPGSLQALQQTILTIARRLEKVPFDTLGGELQQTLQTAKQLLRELDSEVAPQLRALLADTGRAVQAIEGAVGAEAPLQQDVHQALREISEAARSLRLLADYLERHPEALLRGKKEDAR
jgi:paraquat-inducible protein B